MSSPLKKPSVLASPEFTDKCIPKARWLVSTANEVGDVAKLIECLSSTHKVLGSIPSTIDISYSDSYL